MTDLTARKDTFWLHAAALAAFLAVAHPGMPLLAQGLDAEGAIDSIVGSDVQTEEADTEEQTERILAAIESSRENAEVVRKMFNLDELDIVYLPDLAEGNTAIDDKIAEYDDQIEELRQAIEGSAILYHAIDSRGILLRNVAAVEFGDDTSTVTVFTAGEPTPE